MEHVLVIAPTGTVKSMHSDKFPLAFLGRQEIERASDIRFDSDTQKWGIWFRVGEEFVAPSRPSHYGFDSYESARDYEVQVMNRSLAGGVSPLAVE